jgi:chromosome segregation ATPase
MLQGISLDDGIVVVSDRRRVVMQDVLERLERKMDQGFARMDEQFAKVDERFTKVDARFTQIEGRLDKVDEHLVRHDEQFKKIDEHLARHDEQFTKIDEHLARHDEHFSRVDDRFGGIDAQLHKQGVLLEALTGDVKLALEGISGNRQVLDDKFAELSRKLDERVQPARAFPVA